MNSRAKKLLLTTGSVCLLASLFLWHYVVAGKTHPTHSVVLRDPSASVRSGCDCTSALITRAFTDPKVGPGSTVTFTITGDASTANEARVIASVEVPTSRQVMQGREGAAKQRDKLISEINADCAKVVPTKSSPIFLALARAVQHLRNLGCRPTSGCTVYAQTDLEENAEQHIKHILDGAASVKEALPPPIDNTGINVVITGIADTVGATSQPGVGKHLTRPRTTDRAERIRSVWERLFTDRQRLVFEPYCLAAKPVN